MGWRSLLIVVVSLLIFGKGSVIKEDEKSNGTHSELEILKDLVQSLSKDLSMLNETVGEKSSETSALKEIESSLKTLDTKLVDLSNSTESKETSKNVEKFTSDLADLKSKVDLISSRNEKQNAEKLSFETVDAIKNRNYDLAAEKLGRIHNDSRIDWIVKQVYDGEKNNFELIKNFGEKTSPEKSYLIFKSLREEMESNQHTDVDSLLFLIESMTKYVVDRIPDETVAKIAADDILDDLKESLKPLAVDVLTKSIQKRWLSQEGDHLAKKITYDIGDPKYFREISEAVVKNVYPKRDFEQTLVTIESMKRSIPKIILLTALYEEIDEAGISTATVEKLLLCQNAAEKAKENELPEWKTKAEEIYETMPEVKRYIVRQFKKSIFYEFYNENDIDQLSVKVLLYDKDVFESIIQATVDGLYGKMSTAKMIGLFRGSTKIAQSVAGYNAVFKRMKKEGDFVIDSKNVGALLKLNSVVKETQGMKNLKDVDPSFINYLENMNKAMPNLVNEVKAVIKNAIIEGNYTAKDHGLFSKNIMDVGLYTTIINEVTANLFDNVNTERLLDYIRSQDDPRVRVEGLFALQDKLNLNSAYLFEIAQGYKKIVDSDEYKSLTPSHKNKVEFYKMKLPFSIRNAIFGEELHIKNLSRGGEYLFLASDKYNYDKERRSAFTWIPGNRGNQSKWTLETTEEVGVFRLKNIGFDEYLFSGDDSFNFDNERRRVFSWTKGSYGDDENKWRLIPTTGGVYIKNVRYKEYLYAGKHTRDSERRLPFTWRPKGEINDGKWAIEEFLTSF